MFRKTQNLILAQNSTVFEQAETNFTLSQRSTLGSSLNGSTIHKHIQKRRMHKFVFSLGPVLPTWAYHNLNSPKPSKASLQPDLSPGPNVPTPHHVSSSKKVAKPLKAKRLNFLVSSREIPAWCTGRRGRGKGQNRYKYQFIKG